MQSARAALAGALTMLLAVWILAVEQEQTGWNTQDVVFAVVGFLAVIVLMLGIDIRRGGRDGDG